MGMVKLSGGGGGGWSSAAIEKYYLPPTKVCFLLQEPEEKTLKTKIFCIPFNSF